MHANVAALRRRARVMAPELRRLLADVPATLRITRTHRPLLGANRLLVAADAEQDTGEAAFIDELLQSERLACCSSSLGRKRRGGRLHRRGGGGGVSEVPLAHTAGAESVDLCAVVARIEQ